MRTIEKPDMTSQRAKSPNAASDQLVLTVTENGRTLKLDSQGSGNDLDCPLKGDQH
jgi:hypothetical protein